MFIKKEKYKADIKESFDIGIAKGKSVGVTMGVERGMAQGIEEGKKMRQVEIDELKAKIKVLELQLGKAKSLNKQDFKIAMKKEVFRSTITEEDKKAKPVVVAEVKKQISKGKEKQAKL